MPKERSGLYPALKVMITMKNSENELLIVARRIRSYTDVVNGTV